MKTQSMSDYPLDWATGDFVNRYTTHSSRHSSPERDLDHGEMGLSPSPISPVLITGEKLFCRRDNVDHCIAYLNQELGILGFSSLFTPSRNGRGPSDTFDIVKLINTTYELLQQQQKNMKQRTDLEEKNLRIECDNEHLVQMQKRLKEQLESAQREIAMGSERERQLQTKLLKVKEELKAEREEVKRTKANSVHAQKQYDHELRKKEREFNKLKERLHQLLTDKSQEKRIGLEILNSIQRPGGQRALWKTGGKSEEEMYRMLITSYEERQKELMVENNDLRESLRSMQAELIDLLNQQNEDCDSNLEDGEISDTGSVDRLSSGHFQMPYDIVREGIESSLREKWRLLKSKLEGANKGSNGSPTVQQEYDGKLDKNEDIVHLQRQLENYRHVLQQQENLIESLQSKACSSTKDSFYLVDSTSYEEREKLHIDQQFYEKQREKFERERKQLTDAATLLGQERRKFEDERASFYKQQLLTPQRINSVGGQKSKSPDGPRLQHSTPSFSPAPRTSLLSENRMSPSIPRDGPVEIPSTEELYRALSLNTDKSQTINELHETPLKGYSEADEPRTSSSSANQPSSGDSTKENYCDPNMVGARQAKRINEHAQNVKRALQMKRSLSGDF